MQQVWSKKLKNQASSTCMFLFWTLKLSNRINLMSRSCWVCQNVHSLDHWVLSCCPHVSAEIWFFDAKSQNFRRLAAAKFRFRPSGLCVCALATVRTTHTCVRCKFMCSKMYAQTYTLQVQRVRGKNAEIGVSTHFWNISTLSSILGETLIIIWTPR